MRIQYKITYPPEKPSSEEKLRGAIITNSNHDTVWFQTDKYRGKKGFLFLKGKATLINDTLVWDFDNYGLFGLLISVALAINGVVWLNGLDWVLGLWLSIPVLFISFLIFRVRLNSFVARNLAVLYHNIIGM